MKHTPQKKQPVKNTKISSLKNEKRTPSVNNTSIKERIIAFYTTHQKKISYISLVISICIVLIPFLIKRIPFYLYAPGVSELEGGDASSYFDVWYQLKNGFLPHLEIRPLGYPVFLGIVFAIGGSNTAISVFQSIFCIVSSLFFVYSIHKRLKYWSLPLSFFLMLFINADLTFSLETSYRAESLYTSMFMFFFGFLLLALQTQSYLLWTFTALSLWGVVLVKPMSLYLLPMSLIIILFMYLKKYKRKLIRLFSTIILGFYLLYSSYNYFNAGYFSLSAFGSINLLGATIHLIEKDSSYLPSVNMTIDSVKQLVGVNGTVYNHCWTFCDLLQKNPKFYKELGMNTIPKDNKFTIWRVLNPVFKTVAFDAILKKPAEYYEVTKSRFENYFFKRPIVYAWGRSFEEQLQYRIYIKYLKIDTNTLEKYTKEELENVIKFSSFVNYNYHIFKNSDMETYYKDFQKEYLYKQYPPLPDFLDVKNNKVISKIDFTKDYWVQKHNSMEMYLAEKFNSWTANAPLWSILLFITFGLSTLLMFYTKFKDELVIFIFFLTASSVGQGLLVSLVEDAEMRYVYTLAYIGYFSLFFLLMLIYKIFQIVSHKKSLLTKKI